MPRIDSAGFAGLFAGVVLAAVLHASQALSALPGGNVDSTIDPSVVSIDEEKFLGTPIGQDYVLIDENGREFTLGEAMGEPLILLFSYYTCDGVCETLNKHLSNLLKELKQKSPDRKYRALTISFDPNDNLQSLQHFVHMVDQPEFLKDRWTLSVVKNPEQIKALTDSVGVRYFWSYRDKVFVHPNAFIFVTPNGRVARYLHGMAFDADDVDLALIEANWEQIARAKRVIDILAAACFSYNYEEGRYTFNYPLVVGGASLIGGIILIVVSFRATKKRKLRSIKHA